MNARFVGEGILADDGFVGLRSERDGLREKLAGGINVLGDDLGFVRQLVGRGF